MDRALADCKRRFLDGLRAGRMGVAGTRQVLGRAAKFHQHRSFVDHFAGFNAYDVNAEHPIAFRICENLHESIRGLVDLGAAIGGKREFAGGIASTGLLQLFLGLADCGDFRRCIHDARNHVVIHVSRLTCDNFGNGHTFVLGLVRQHRSRHHVANGVDALHVGGEVRVDLYTTAIIDANAGLLQAETFGVGHAADADQHDVGFQRLLGAAGSRLDLRDERLARRIDAGDFRTEPELKPLLFPEALKLPRDLTVHAGQNAVQEFDDRDLGAEPVPDRAELEPNDACAYDQQFARHLVERQRAGRGYDAFFVDLDPLEPRDIGAGGDHNVLCLDKLRLAVGTRDLDLAGAENPAFAVDDVDLVLLHQELDAFDVAVDALLLEIHHRGQVELGRPHANAHLGKGVRGLLEHLGSMQQRLRRHAADVEAGAAESVVLLDDRDLHAELSRADRADISAGTSTNDNEIVGSHDSIL